jgi:hypothetical protein
MLGRAVLNMSLSIGSSFPNRGRAFRNRSNPPLDDDEEEDEDDKEEEDDDAVTDPIPETPSSPSSPLVDAAAGAGAAGNDVTDDDADDFRPSFPIQDNVLMSESCRFVATRNGDDDDCRGSGDERTILCVVVARASTDAGTIIIPWDDDDGDDGDGERRIVIITVIAVNFARLVDDAAPDVTPVVAVLLPFESWPFLRSSPASEIGGPPALAVPLPPSSPSSTRSS